MSMGGTSRSRYYNPEYMLKHGNAQERLQAEKILASQRYAIVPGYNKGGYQVVSEDELRDGNGKK